MAAYDMTYPKCYTFILILVLGALKKIVVFFNCQVHACMYSSQNLACIGSVASCDIINPNYHIFYERVN